MSNATQKVSQSVINRMEKFYGSLDAARRAYSNRRREMTAHNEGPGRMLGGKVLWVDGAGEIKLVFASEVFYDRSPDASSVLPA